MRPSLCPTEGQEQGGWAVSGQNQNQVSSTFTLEVILGLLQPLQPLLEHQVGLRLLKMVPNDFLWPKTWV